METLTALPSEITAGTTVKFKRTTSDHPSNDGWTLTLYIVGAKRISKAGVADGSGGYDFTLLPTETDDLTTPGNYQFFERATKGGEVYDSNTSPTLRSGVVKVLQDVATAADGDFQTFEEKQLAAVEARIEGRLTKDQESIQIDGIAVVKIAFEKLYAYRRALRQAVALQRRRGRFETPMRAVFGPTS